jgi:DNA polymerase
MMVGDGNVLDGDVKALISALEWQAAMGADEALGDQPCDRYAEAEARLAARRAAAASAQGQSQPPGNRSSGNQTPGVQSPENRAKPSANAPLGVAEAVAQATATAQACTSLEELKAALEKFEGCDLRFHAKNMVFGAGDVGAPLMLIGDAPDTEEDRAGAPFVARTGALLDKMLQAIGLSRADAYLSSPVFWRPAGNRSPTEGEMAICRPFLEKQITLVGPKLLLLVGGQAVSSMVASVGPKQGITRNRGTWFDVPIAGSSLPALASFHPAYLLKTPSAKRQAWQDLLALQRRMSEMGLITDEKGR